MITANMALRAIHEGRNLKRIRKMLGVKKHELAAGLGISRQEISKLEGQQIIDDDLISKLAGTINPGPEPDLASDKGMIVVFVEAVNVETDVQIDRAGADVETEAGIDRTNPTVETNAQNHSSETNKPRNGFDAIGKINELCGEILKVQEKQIELLEKILQERAPAGVQQ